MKKLLILFLVLLMCLAVGCSTGNNDDNSNPNSNSSPSPSTNQGMTIDQYRRKFIAESNQSPKQPVTSDVNKSSLIDMDKIMSLVDEVQVEPSNTYATTPNSQSQEVTVYVTESGSKYHRSGCQYLSKSKISMDLSSAKISYDPCSKCHPPS